MPAPEDFAHIGAASAPAFSRDGQTIFHLRGAGTPDIWAIDRTTGESRQLTDTPEKVAFLRRSPTDDRIIFGTDRGGDERQQLFLLDPDLKPITTDITVIHDFGAWAPDGTKFAYAANTPEESRFDIYINSLPPCGGGPGWGATGGTHLTSISSWRPDGQRLALIEDRGYGDQSLRLLDPETGQSALFPQPGPTNWQSVRWAADNVTLLALTDHGGSNFLRLCRLFPETGEVTTIYAASDRDVDAWAISPDQETLATIENDRGWSVLRLGPIDGERPEITDLPPGVFSDPSFSPDNTTLALTASAPTHPSSLWLVENNQPRLIYQPDPFPQDFRPLELVHWPSNDGRQIPGLLSIPSGPKPETGYPAVVWVHGGPVGQTRPNFRPDIQMLLSQGFAVLMPNVRGSSGYGRAWCEMDDRDRRLDSVADLAAGARWLAAHPDIDPARIGVMGQSYGGFMVLSAITEYPDLFRAAVNYYGIADFTTLLAGTGSWRRDHRAAEYGDPATDADQFARISPIHRADRIACPLLVMHGTRDPRVPIGESEQIVAALRRRNHPVDYLIFDYAGHGFIRPQDRARAYTAVADFFRKHLQA